MVTATAASASTAFAINDTSSSSIHAGSFADANAFSKALQPLPVYLGAASYSSAWKKPNSMPCRQLDGSNPCWDGDDIFNRAVANGQSSPTMISRLRSDFAAERFTVDEICDGDVISNSGAREGRAFFIPREGVAFDRDWLNSQDLEHRVLADGRTCIPSQNYGAWHFVHACGNAVQLLERFDPDMPRRRPAARLLNSAAPITAASNRANAPARGGFSGGGGFGGGGGGGGPTSGDDVDDLFRDSVIRPLPAPPPGGGSTLSNPPPAPPVIDIDPPYEVAPPPLTPVPAPAALLLMLTGLGALAAATAGRRRAKSA